MVGVLPVDVVGMRAWRCRGAMLKIQYKEVDDGISPGGTTQNKRINEIESTPNGTQHVRRSERFRFKRILEDDSPHKKV